eukprot:1160376-Pelagomonas_calceolata.AAC.4
MQCVMCPQNVSGLLCLSLFRSTRRAEKLNVAFQERKMFRSKIAPSALCIDQQKLSMAVHAPPKGPVSVCSMGFFLQPVWSVVCLSCAVWSLQAAHVVLHAVWCVLEARSMHPIHALCMPDLHTAVALCGPRLRACFVPALYPCMLCATPFALCMPDLHTAVALCGPRLCACFAPALSPRTTPCNVVPPPHACFVQAAYPY